MLSPLLHKGRFDLLNSMSKRLCLPSLTRRLYPTTSDVVSRSCSTSKCAPAIIAVDWGTTSFRAYIINESGTVIATTEDDEAGMLVTSRHGDFDAALEQQLAAFKNIDLSNLSVFITGMAGSKTGWHEVPYIPAPFRLDSLRHSTKQFRSSKGREIIILPGVSKSSGIELEDVMRGEETQIIGACHIAENSLQEALIDMNIQDKRSDKSALFCLPGSHSKWAEVSRNLEDQSLEMITFYTHMTGELYALMSKDSILSELVQGNDSTSFSLENPKELEAFEKGLNIAKGTGGILHHMFRVRAYGVSPGIPSPPPAEMQAMLSGIMIGSEVSAVCGDIDEKARQQRIIQSLPTMIPSIASTRKESLSNGCDRYINETLTKHAEALSKDAQAILSILQARENILTEDKPTVTVVGKRSITEPYVHTLKAAGFRANSLCGKQAVCAGIHSVAKSMGAFSKSSRSFSTSTDCMHHSVSLDRFQAPGWNGAHPELIECLQQCPLIAILRGLKVNQAAQVGSILVSAGFKAIEVPLNSPDALKSISTLNDTIGKNALIGAGTVLSVSAVEAVAAAGGRLLVTPNTDVNVINAGRNNDMIVIPGALTPTEAFTAIAAGAHGIKMFPASGGLDNVDGGMAPPAALKALRAVLPSDCPVIPVGGIENGNLSPYASSGAAGFGIGSCLFTPEMTMEDLEKRARELVSTVDALYKI